MRLTIICFHSNRAIFNKKITLMTLILLNDSIKESMISHIPEQAGIWLILKKQSVLAKTSRQIP